MTTKTELPIRLTVRDREGVVLNEMILNFLSRSDRQRIAKTAWWAMHNGHEMVTVPIEEGNGNRS